MCHCDGGSRCAAVMVDPGVPLSRRGGSRCATVMVDPGVPL